jgi:hypothetical protein
VEYAEWAATERDAAFAPEVQPVSSRGGSVTRLTIISPEQGDLYRIPPGVESRYASIALRAAGAARPEDIRWYVDGRHVGGPRWILVPGRHQIRAETGRERADVTIIVEQP